MKIYFEAYFNTDNDFRFEESQVRDRLQRERFLYEGATTQYEYQHDDDDIMIRLTADGDAAACRMCLRDLLEELICSIRTFKHWLVKDLYELLNYFLEDLWKEPNQLKERGLFGNYTGTWLTLKMEE